MHILRWLITILYPPVTPTEQEQAPDFIEDSAVTTFWNHHPSISKALGEDLNAEDYAEWAEYAAKQPITLHHLHQCYNK